MEKHHIRAAVSKAADATTQSGARLHVLFLDEGLEGDGQTEEYRKQGRNQRQEDENQVARGVEWVRVYWSALEK